MKDSAIQRAILKDYNMSPLSFLWSFWQPAPFTHKMECPESPAHEGYLSTSSNETRKPEYAKCAEGQGVAKAQYCTRITPGHGQTEGFWGRVTLASKPPVHETKRSVMQHVDNKSHQRNQDTRPLRSRIISRPPGFVCSPRTINPLFDGLKTCVTLKSVWYAAPIPTCPCSGAMSRAHMP